MGETQSTAIGPAVSARITALGSKSNLVRNVAAGAGLAAILAAAIWLIVIPKLKSIDQPIPNSIPVQLPNDGAKVDSSVGVSQPPPPFGSAVKEDGKLPVIANPDSDHAAAATPPPEPSVPEPRKYFRVVIASFETKQAANEARETLSASILN